MHFHREFSNIHSLLVSIVPVGNDPIAVAPCSLCTPALLTNHSSKSSSKYPFSSQALRIVTQQDVDTSHRDVPNVATPMAKALLLANNFMVPYKIVRTGLSQSGMIVRSPLAQSHETDKNAYMRSLGSVASTSSWEQTDENRLRSLNQWNPKNLVWICQTAGVFLMSPACPEAESFEKTLMAFIPACRSSSVMILEPHMTMYFCERNNSWRIHTLFK